MNVLIDFCQLDTRYAFLGRGNLNWENASLSLPCSQVHKPFSWLMVDEGASNDLITVVGLVSPGQVVLSCIGKWTEQVMRSRLVSSVPPWPRFQFLTPVSALEFLLWIPQLMQLDPEVSSFIPQFLFVKVIYHSNRNPKRPSNSRYYVTLKKKENGILLYNKNHILKFLHLILSLMKWENFLRWVLVIYSGQSFR